MTSKTVARDNHTYLPFCNEALRLLTRHIFMSSELIFHILVSKGSQIYWQESMQEENPLVQRAYFGDVGRVRHDGELSFQWSV